MDGIGSEVMLGYLQSRGQSIAEKIAVLNKAARAAGLDAEFRQDDNRAAWYGPDAEEASRFQDRLGRVWCNEFNQECRNVEALIAEFKTKKERALTTPDNNLDATGVSNYTNVINPIYVEYYSHANCDCYKIDLPWSKFRRATVVLCPVASGIGRARDAARTVISNHFETARLAPVTYQGEGGESREYDTVNNLRT